MVIFNSYVKLPEGTSPRFKRGNVPLRFAAKVLRLCQVPRVNRINDGTGVLSREDNPSWRPNQPKVGS